MSGDLPAISRRDSNSSTKAGPSDYRKDLNHKIYQNRGTSLDVDVYLIPTLNNGNPVEIPCHRVFLRNCQFFDNFFLLNSISKFEIDTDPDTLEAIVKYIYTGEIEFNSNNFLKWYKTAKQFDLKDLLQKCNNYKSSIIISENNWLEYFRFANTGSNKKIINKVFYFLKRISSEFYNSTAFLSLELKEVKQILCCTIPRIFANQEDFTKSVLKWLTHLPERNIYINEISKLRWIDKEIVDLSDSDSETQSQPSTSTVANLIDVRKRPRLELQVQETQSGSASTSTSTEDICIIFNVQNIEQNTSHSSLYSYSMKTQNVSEIVKLDQYTNLRDFQLLCSGSKNIIRLGGIGKNRSLIRPQIEIYDSITSMVVKQRFLMLKPKLTSFASIYYKSNIFLVGGLNETGNISSHVNKIPCNERDPVSWMIQDEPFTFTQYCGQMKYKRKLPAVAILGTTLYISGGIGKCAENLTAKNVRLKSFEMVDLLAPVFVPRLISPMAKPRCGHKLIAFENKLYSIGGFFWSGNGVLERSRDVEIYDPEENEWSFGTPMINARAEFAAFVMGKYIFALGGNEDNDCQNMEKYDPASNTWSMEHCPDFPANSDFFINTIVNNA